jgi:hypothetical protein
MANQEHIERIQQGVDSWNQWRQESPDIQPDLSFANLSRKLFRATNFSGTNFNGSVLRGTDLSYANLNGANLEDANLSFAILSSTSFSRANLSGANLTMATLYEANFQEADISLANFNGAYLRKTNFSLAIAALTIFGDMDLRHAEGLDTVAHQTGSIIDIDTIYRAKNSISERFWRNVGVPDSFLVYVKSLMNEPIEYYKCFISYSNRDQTFAESLYADLQSKGVRCWFAPEDLKIGDHYHQRIDESIRLYDKLILILSEHAVQSAWVEREMVAAREKEDREQREVLFPIRLDDAVMDTAKAWAADVRRRWHIGDFTRWKDHDVYQQAFDRLLRDLKATAQKRGENNYGE